jgi:hypothetical protein
MRRPPFAARLMEGHAFARWPAAATIWLLAVLTLPDAFAQSLRPWEVFELVLTARDAPANPYALIPPDPGTDPVTVTFTGLSGDAAGHLVRVVGFWDGGNTWRARFAPPATGSWRYVSRSVDEGLDGQEGSIRVEPWSDEDLRANPTRRGFVRVRNAGESAGRIFEYADGTPFLWIGDTWWNWTKRRIHLSTFHRLVDDRAAKGFTIGQLFVAANGWGRESSLLDETFSELDLALAQKVDSLIVYANRHGITVWVQGWWSREGLNALAGEEKMRRWWRYLVHRLGAYNVVWVVAGEYNLGDYGGLGIDFWKRLGAMIKAEDPVPRIVSAHPTPPGWSGGDAAPQWSTGEVLHEEPWLDYNQSQPGHGRWRNERIPDIIAADVARRPAKPTLVTEPWYEFVEGSAAGRDVRYGAWSAILSGAAGHSYGGGHVWLAHVPESPAGAGPWPLDPGFEQNTLDYEGARSMGYLATFFRNVAWWRLQPHPELISEYAGGFAAAEPGREIVAYLRWGGGAKIDLRPSAQSDTFTARWFDPATGAYGESTTVPGGDVRYFAPPEDYPATRELRDRVLHITRTPAEDKGEE